MKYLINPKRVKRILDHIEDKNEFILELVDAINVWQNTGDSKDVNECLDSWDVSAELMAIPGLKERAWESFESLKAQGIVK